jgi:hypothetical protein
MDDENQLDDTFYDRADAHIGLSNEQSDKTPLGRVSASMMYATARYNAWVSASGFQSGEDMAKSREQTIEYFVQGYRMMLEQNLDQYIANFDAYMKPKDEG